ncbi:glycine betaine ABC transporter substrate-binding protein [Alteribacillus sp. YIM 98480]|uniref:glycine betaine ABC transporter substrate-binding protein n=1 Tax=Alteribacillus sp. YIM 98480 TaxID=2606599 RepID=UPI001E4061E0|nr:glycine betaine ABC transporter substrate-binding protein [Alteribacillus sp. YIM 98480]
MKNFSFVLSLTAMLILAACGDDGAEENNGETSSKEAETIEIGYNNWAENIAASNMWKILLEEEGYDVELINLEKTAVFAGVAEGDLDIGMEVWIPFTDQHHIEEYGNDFQTQAEWYENTELGLVVPEYMDEVNSLEDLNDYTEETDGEIIGIDPGASLMELTEEAIEHYDLNYDLQASSEQAMMTELDEAYQNEEPIVVTLWSPHWAFADYDLKYLEEPDTVYGEADDIVYISNDGFEEEYSEVAEWMNNWKFDDESLGGLMSTINEMDDPEEGAQAWIEENRDLVEEWIN